LLLIERSVVDLSELHDFHPGSGRYSEQVYHSDRSVREQFKSDKNIRAATNYWQNHIFTKKISSERQLREAGFGHDLFADELLSDREADEFDAFGDGDDSGDDVEIREGGEYSDDDEEYHQEEEDAEEYDAEEDKFGNGKKESKSEVKRSHVKPKTRAKPRQDKPSVTKQQSPGKY
jgi:hypothetical protein